MLSEGQVNPPVASPQQAQSPTSTSSQAVPVPFTPVAQDSKVTSAGAGSHAAPQAPLYVPASSAPSTGKAVLRPSHENFDVQRSGSKAEGMHVSVYTPKTAPTTPPPSQPAAFSAVSSKGLPRQRVMTTAPTPAQVSSTLPVASTQQMSPSGNVQPSPTQVSRRTQVSGQTAPTMSSAPTQVSPFEAGIGDRYGMDAPEYQWPEDVSKTLEQPAQEVSAAPQQAASVSKLCQVNLFSRSVQPLKWSAPYPNKCRK